MKIHGIGTDIVNMKRIEQYIRKNETLFTKRVFSKKEINLSKNNVNKTSFYSKRFAAKEAFSKAFGLGISKGIFFKDIEILNNRLGKPYINLKGSTLQIVKKKFKKKKYDIYLSITDDKPWAQSTVIITSI